MNVKRRDCCQPLGTGVKNTVTNRVNAPTAPSMVKNAVTSAAHQTPGKLRNSV